MLLDYSLLDVAPYINWLYLEHAWGMNGKPASERLRLRKDAEERLERYGRMYQTHAVFHVFDVHSNGDDIVMNDTVFPCLRQQEAGSKFLCLADYVNPIADRVGVFATSVDEGLETDFEQDPYEKLMMQILADRLAEATAERMHEEVRKTYWGYAEDEQLSIADMLCERWQGIRPAVGYPSLPDTSLNFLIDSLINMGSIGIRLTESGAMKPHASVSGLMIAHPAARYFSLGKIGQDQLRDYARRRGFSVDEMKKYLQANL